MKKYTIGEVSSLLKVKPHVLRYWEKEFSFLSPAKNNAGRRLYSERELHFLFRLKYLLHVKRFTIEGAKQKIWDELSSLKIDLKTSVHEIRDELLTILNRIKHKKK